MESFFEEPVALGYINRINKLTPTTKGNWGKMNVSQMLAHCSGAFEENSKRPNLIMRIKINIFFRSVVIGENPYPKNMKTSKKFIVSDNRDWHIEKKRLIKGIERVQKLGANYFHHRKHPIFGKMTTLEWSTFFSKHLDHHLTQFGV